jgi:hypothetical protein
MSSVLTVAFVGATTVFAKRGVTFQTPLDRERGMALVRGSAAAAGLCHYLHKSG